ncbi:FAD-dependent monooxygenase [Nitrospirillum viridazoti]|uniref:FAD-dependent monooxygenase n=1 Tax=Nitrospirillum viridazoti TaxID=3144925 RepID=UPI00031BBE7F
MSTEAPAPTADTDLIADVAIVGGGLAGLSLAAALGTAGVRTLCIDRDSPAHQLGATFDGRTTAISHGSKKILEGAGVWAHLNGDAGPILDIRVTDQNRPTFLHYDHREVGDQPFGYIVENIVLRRAQFARLAELPSVTHLAPVEVTALDRGNAKGGRRHGHHHPGGRPPRTRPPGGRRRRAGQPVPQGRRHRPGRRQL